MMLMMFHSTWDGYLNRDSRLSARGKHITSWGNKKKHRVGRSYLRRWGVCWGPMGCFSIRERFVAGFRLLLLWQLYPQHRRLLDAILLILLLDTILLILLLDTILLILLLDTILLILLLDTILLILLLDTILLISIDTILYGFSRSRP